MGKAPKKEEPRPRASRQGQAIVGQRIEANLPKVRLSLT
jgi:hypothetical protein